jgi:thiol-disulfide isomerase/thioredoxin
MMAARKVLVVGLAIFMVLGTMSFVAGDEDIPVANADDKPEPKAGSTPRTVLLEEFTATWCPMCNTVAPAYSRIADEYPEKDVATLVWHTASSELGNMLTSIRSNYYGWYWLPTATVDG